MEVLLAPAPSVDVAVAGFGLWLAGENALALITRGGARRRGFLRPGLLLVSDMTSERSSGVAPASSPVSLFSTPLSALGSLENKMKAKYLLLLWALTLSATGWLPGQ